MGSHCVKQHKGLEMQTFSNQRSNALDSANVAPAVSGLGRPHMDLRVGEFSNSSFSVEPRQRKKYIYTYTYIMRMKRDCIKSKALGVPFFQQTGSAGF